MKRKGFDAGSTTVEYALVALAAAAFGGVLLAVIGSDAIKAALSNLLLKALG